MNNIVKFQDKELHTHDFNGLPGLSSVELANGLGYADESAVTRIYNRHSDEFTSDMVQTVKLTVRGLQRQIKVFSPRGCHLVAMFAHTPFAKAFRKWVLDVLDKKPIANQNSLTQDRDALKAIGGIVKRCAVSAVREAIMDVMTAAEQPDFFGEVKDEDLIRAIWGWYAGHHKKTFDAIRAITAENDELKCKLLTIKKALN